MSCRVPGRSAPVTCTRLQAVSPPVTSSPTSTWATCPKTTDKPPPTITSPFEPEPGMTKTHTHTQTDCRENACTRGDHTRVCVCVCVSHLILLNSCRSCETFGTDERNQLQNHFPVAKCHCRGRGYVPWGANRVKLFTSTTNQGHSIDFNCTQRDRRYGVGIKSCITVGLHGRLRLLYGHQTNTSSTVFTR
jgi:hypothetical protein